MRVDKRGLAASVILASVLFVVTFVQFCHCETNASECRTCPACQVNCASVGIAQVPSAIVFTCILIGTLVPADTPQLLLSFSDARISRAPPLS